MKPLLVEPTSEQMALLDVVYRGREQAGWPSFQRADEVGGQMQRVGKPGDWPIFQYVELTLYQERGLDASAVILGCPSVRFNGGQGRYGWIDFEQTHVNMLGPDDKVRLTVAGMTRQPRAVIEAEVFIDVIALLVDIDGSVRPSPTEVQSVEVTAAELQRRLEPPHGRWRLGATELGAIAAMLDREPSTWNCRVQQGDAIGSWSATVSPFIRRYGGLGTPEEYVERLVQRLVPQMPAPEPLLPSSLSLPEAIDYLNAVWRAHARKPLLRIARAEAAAKLAFDCATADELEARLSAFCGILSDVQLPESANNKSLAELKLYLAENLPAEGMVRAERAVDVLRAFFDIRAWRQHPGGRAETQGRRGMERLEIELPTSDWQGAWRHLQARAVAALAALREEIETLA